MGANKAKRTSRPDKSKLYITLERKTHEEFKRLARVRKVPASGLIRQLIETEVESHRDLKDARRWFRRRYRLRRCLVCGAVIRNGYSCPGCRKQAPEEVEVNGVVLRIPLTRQPQITARPDMRSGDWTEAEEIVLDALAPVVAVVYEALAGRPSLEPTDLDEVADLLQIAVRLQNCEDESHGTSGTSELGCCRPGGQAV